MFEIAEGIVAQSTKDKSFEIERENEKQEKYITDEKKKTNDQINADNVKAFLKYFANKKFDGDDAMGEFFISFIYRVVLFDDCVFIFYNTSPDMSNKFRLDKNELNDMKNFIRKRKSTLEPLVFKSGACGGGGGECAKEINSHARKSFARFFVISQMYVEIRANIKYNGFIKFNGAVMGKLQKLIDNKAQSAEFMCGEIAHICNDMPKRDPGSVGEKMACEYMAEYLRSECKCERSDVESFKEHPHSFFGWIYFTISFALAGMVAFFFSPPLGAALIGIGFAILVIQFGFYTKLIDNFFPEKTGHSVTAIKKCRGEVKGRVFFNGHPDAVWNWPVNNRFGGKAYLAHLILSILGALISLGLNIAAAVVTKGRLTTDYTVAGYVTNYGEGIFWAGISVLAFVPLLVGMYFMWDPNTIVDGANDNLTGCYMGIAILKAMQEQGIELEHTEVGVIISGSEEAGLRGAMAWCEQHKGEFDDVPTWIYSYDTIHESRFLGVNYRDLNGTVKSDKEVSDSFMEAASQLGIKCTKTWVPPFGGATDNAAFNKAGFKSTGITALNHSLQDYYHTMRDTADNLNPECLADCYAISVKCLENFDAQFDD